MPSLGDECRKRGSSAQAGVVLSAPLRGTSHCPLPLPPWAQVRLTGGTIPSLDGSSCPGGYTDFLSHASVLSPMATPTPDLRVG